MGTHHQPPPALQRQVSRIHTHTHTPLNGAGRVGSRYEATDVKTSSPQPMRYVNSRGPMSLAGLMA